MQRAEGQDPNTGKPHFDHEEHLKPHSSSDKMGKGRTAYVTPRPNVGLWSWCWRDGGRLASPLCSQAVGRTQAWVVLLFITQSCDAQLLGAWHPGSGMGARWRAPRRPGPRPKLSPGSSRAGEEETEVGKWRPVARAPGTPRALSPERRREGPAPPPQRPGSRRVRSGACGQGGAAVSTAPRGRGRGSGRRARAAVARCAGRGGAAPAHCPARAMTPAALSCRLVAADPRVRLPPPPPAPGRALCARGAAPQ